jgi:hypothetical protein
VTRGAAAKDVVIDRLGDTDMIATSVPAEGSVHLANSDSSRANETTGRIDPSQSADRQRTATYKYKVPEYCSCIVLLAPLPT